MLNISLREIALYRLPYEITMNKFPCKIGLCGLHGEVASCKLGLHYINSIVELHCEIALWDYRFILRNLHYADSIFCILTHFIMQISLYGFRPTYSILLHYANCILCIPLCIFYYTHSILLYCANSIMWIPSHRFQHVDSVMEILSYIFYCVYSIMRILLYVFHCTYFIMRILLCVFFHKITLWNFIMRILLCAFHYVYSIVCISLCTFHGGIASWD